MDDITATTQTPPATTTQPPAAPPPPAVITTDLTPSSPSHTSSSERVGRWTDEEHEKFLQGLSLYHTEWKKIASLIPTRTVVQVRTHAQKFFLSGRARNKEGGGGGEHKVAPPKIPKGANRPTTTTLTSTAMPVNSSTATTSSSSDIPPTAGTHSRPLPRKSSSSRIKSQRHLPLIDTKQDTMALATFPGDDPNFLDEFSPTGPDELDMTKLSSAATTTAPLNRNPSTATTTTTTTTTTTVTSSSNDFISDLTLDAISEDDVIEPLPHSHALLQMAHMWLTEPSLGDLLA